ncbi:c-type cytochrome [Helicobacter anatolicus]|uniref:c-type cytochrome n=1 Tax=Helicobacter anatolicus TaxID=2905874 RepID=UPI001E5C4C19|nr:c-type cytochrome [Helicobacter anatolicus]MCE3037817.1 c-type cytochrome [Helicobacter anatolicus]
MREIKILAILIIVIGTIYWGVEPLAHSVMHPKVAPADFNFEDLKAIDLSKADAQKGKELTMNNCAGCHGIKNAGMEAPMDAESAASSFGVVPLDLSSAGAIFDEKYLANFIADPVKAAILEHKFKVSCEGLDDANAKECEKSNEGKADYPMSAFKGVLSESEIADIVAYLKSIASKDLSDKEVFMNACQRCHSMKYDGVMAATPDENLKNYLGTKAPDLSMMIRSKGENYLDIFINNPQKELAGTPMPRVGVTQAAQKQIIQYIEQVGDSSKNERNALGIKIMIFFVVLSVLAYAWKRKIWKDLH